MEIETLVAAAQSGDTDALEQAWEWLYDMLGGYLGRWFPPYDVDDLRQECGIVIFKLLPDFEDRGPGSFGRWAREIARRRARDRWATLARQSAKLHRFAHEPRESTLSPDTKVTMRELEQLLEDCSGVLTEAEREALRWGFEDKDDRELAKLRGVAVQTIWTRRHRGYQRLAAWIKSARRTPRQPYLSDESSGSQRR